MNMQSKVFLGGTRNGSTWRNHIIPKLNIPYFNPVVDVWDDKAKQREVLEKFVCKWSLYVITPKLEGFYSIAEVVEWAMLYPQRTIFSYIKEDDANVFTPHQIKSLDGVGRIVQKYGGMVCDFNDIAKLLNGLVRKNA